MITPNSRGIFGLRSLPTMQGPGQRRDMPRAQIDMRRRQAAQLQIAGMDTSPVQHWAQGLARVGQSVAGALMARRAERDALEHEDAQQRIIAALPGAAPDQIAGLLMGLDPDKAEVGMQIYKAQHPTPPAMTEFERMLQAGGFSDQERVDLIRKRAENQANPIQAVPVFDENGKQGLRFIRPTDKGGGGPVSLGSAGDGPPSTLPPDFDGFDKGGASPAGARTFP